jgi:hypothetical protein
MVKVLSSKFILFGEMIFGTHCIVVAYVAVKSVILVWPKMLKFLNLPLRSSAFPGFGKKKGTKNGSKLGRS